METTLLQEFLPEQLLNQFEVINHFKLCSIDTKQMFFDIHLDELNELPQGYSKSDYESKGFLPASIVQDFPIRGKAVYLSIRRRRWRHRETKKDITNDYSFIAEGSRLTQELSDFLKGTGREPRRYNE